MSNFALNDTEKDIITRLLRIDQVNAALEQANETLTVTLAESEEEVLDLLDELDKTEEEVQRQAKEKNKLQSLASKQAAEIEDLSQGIADCQRKHNETLGHLRETNQMYIDDLDRYQCYVSENEDEINHLEAVIERYKASLQIYKDKVSALEEDKDYWFPAPSRVWSVMGKGLSSRKLYGPVIFASEPSVLARKALAHQWDGAPERYDGLGYDGTHVELTVDEMEVQ